MIRSIKSASIGLPHPDPTGLHKAGAAAPTTLPAAAASTQPQQQQQQPPKPVEETRNLKARAEELTKQLLASTQNTTPEMARLGALFTELVQLRGAEISELERLLASQESQSSVARAQRAQQTERADLLSRDLRLRDDGIAQMRLEHEAEVSELRTKFKNANEAYDILRQQKIEVDTEVVALRHDLEVAEAMAKSFAPTGFEILDVDAGAELKDGAAGVTCRFRDSSGEAEELSLVLTISLETARKLLRKVKGKNA